MLMIDLGCDKRTLLSATSSLYLRRTGSQRKGVKSVNLPEGSRQLFLGYARANQETFTH
jgi:hypothetical protein